MKNLNEKESKVQKNTSARLLARFAWRAAPVPARFTTVVTTLETIRGVGVRPLLHHHIDIAA